MVVDDHSMKELKWDDEKVAKPRNRKQKMLRTKTKSAPNRRNVIENKENDFLSSHQTSQISRSKDIGRIKEFKLC